MRPDVTAGLVLTALLIPAGMGYAEAAGLPAYAGLYATIIPLLAYALVGPSKILVLGPDSSLAPLIAAAVLPLAVADDPESALALAGVLGVLVGLILLVGGFLHLGFVTELLSKPIRLGYLNAIALIVVVGQLPKLLGFSVDASGLIGEIGEIGQSVVQGNIDPVAAAVGIGSLAVIIGFRIWVPRIPGVLVAVVGAIILSAALGLTDDIGMVGALPAGLPLPSFGGVDWGDVGNLVGPAAGIALIAFADTGVLSRTFAARHGEDVNGSTEMKAVGVANIAGGLFGGFPISASGSRTPVAEQSGARTQLACVVGALAVLVFVLVAPGVTTYLPDATLGAVVIVAATALVDVRWNGPDVAHEHRGVRTRRRGIPRGRLGGRAAGHPRRDRAVLRRGGRAGVAAVPHGTRPDDRPPRLPRRRTPPRRRSASPDWCWCASTLPSSSPTARSSTNTCARWWRQRRPRSSGWSWPPSRSPVSTPPPSTNSSTSTRISKGKRSGWCSRR